MSSYKYVVSKKAIETVPIKPKVFDDLYNNIIVQTCLRNINEVFTVANKHVESVVFNGWVSGIDKATGQPFTSCIISLQSMREEFEKIDLSRVDVNACFKGLKGIHAGNLSMLAPIKPIMSIDHSDRRFVESKEVLANLNSTDNLASMPWEDFEHLVRELFQRIFSNDGAEVRVTQASRDGGVDAIVFDPDPIKGGKFVIQAKRYNNVVPVSASRDLYGTMIAEGAVKGILVTTSHFGSDTHSFVKDKPISLIAGSNLVYLFNEHGYKVKIETKKS